MHRNLLITLIALLLTALPALATEADFEKNMARGVTALDGGDPALARQEFTAALKERPGDPDAKLYLAIALNRSGDPAAETELKAALRRTPGHPRVNFELGTHYYNTKMYEESSDYFENVLTLNPDPEMKIAAERYLGNIRAIGSGKRWSATLTGGMQHDSNVPMASNGAQLPVGITRKSDWRAIFNLALAGTPVRNDGTELTLNYGFYQTKHLNLNEFDLTQNSFDLTIKKRIQPKLSGKLGLSVEILHLDGNQFGRSYSMNPGLTFDLTDTAATTVEYRLRKSDYQNSALFPTNHDRQGLTHTITLDQQLRLSETFSLRFGYSFDKDQARVTSWNSDTHRGNARLGILLPYSLLLDLSGEASGRRYQGIQSGTSAVRNETTIVGSTSLNWQMSSCCGVATGYHYTSNTSNIPGYEYTRGITSILLQGRF